MFLLLSRKELIVIFIVHTLVLWGPCALENFKSVKVVIDSFLLDKNKSTYYNRSIEVFSPRVSSVLKGNICHFLCLPFNTGRSEEIGGAKC